LIENIAVSDSLQAKRESCIASSVVKVDENSIITEYDVKYHRRKINSIIKFFVEQIDMCKQIQTYLLHNGHAFRKLAAKQQRKTQCRLEANLNVFSAAALCQKL